MQTQVEKPVSHRRARVFQGLVILAAVGFGILFVLARNTPYFAFDLAIEHAIQQIPGAWFGQLMLWLTLLGAAPLSYVWCGAIVIFLFVRGLRWEAVMAAVSAIGVSLLGSGVKDIVQRARPTPDLVHVFSPINEYSFPSGHVLFFTAFLGFLIFLLYTLAPHSWWRTVGMVLLALPIGLISVSRIYLGQHWPSDTLGAYLLATVWLAVMIYVYGWGKRRKLLERK